MGLTKTSWIGVFIIISIPILFTVFYAIGVITNVISTIEQVIVAVFAVMIVSGVALIYKGWKSKQKVKEITVDPRFDYLTVWYSDSRDSPKSEKLNRPYFIVNRDTKQAYFVSDLIIPFVKKDLFQWDTRPSKNALLAYFRKEGINPNYTNPKLKELGLKINKNGILTRQTPEPEIVSKLKGRTLDDLQMQWIYPARYRISFLFKKGNKPPAKRVLRKFSTNEIFSAPRHDLLLTEKQIITKQQFCFSPFFDNIKKWSERKGYTYRPRPFLDKELLAEK